MIWNKVKGIPFSMFQTVEVAPLCVNTGDTLGQHHNFLYLLPVFKLYMYHGVTIMKILKNTFMSISDNCNYSHIHF